MCHLHCERQNGHSYYKRDDGSNHVHACVSQILLYDGTWVIFECSLLCRRVMAPSNRYPRTKFGFTGVGYNGSSGKLVYLTDHHGIARPNEVEQEAVPRNSEELIALEALFTTGCLCNNATLVQEVGAESQGRCGGAMSGQPTELALLVASEKAGFPDQRPNYIRLVEVPFSRYVRASKFRFGVRLAFAFVFSAFPQ